MIVGRLLAGIGIGVTSAIVPLYISEVVTLKIILTFVIMLTCSYGLCGDLVYIFIMGRFHQLKFVELLDLLINFLFALGFS